MSAFFLLSGRPQKLDSLNTIGFSLSTSVFLCFFAAIFIGEGNLSIYCG